MNTNTTRTVLLAVLFAVLVSLAGCSLPVSDDDPNVDEDELQAATVETMENVSTASIQADITMETDGETILEMEMDGVANWDEERARLNTTMTQMGQRFDVEQYVIEETVYMNAEAFGGWVSQEAGAQTGFQGSEWGPQQQVLEESELEVTDETTTNGHDVYVAEMDVDEEVLNDVLEENIGDEGMSGAASSVEIEDVSVTQHIDVETNHVRYTNMEYTMNALGEEVTFVFEQELSDFDEPVEITLPEQAEDAQPIDQGTGF